MILIVSVELRSNIKKIVKILRKAFLYDNQFLTNDFFYLQC